MPKKHRFRLTTGYECLYAHICRFRIEDSPTCPFCCSVAAMNADHFPVCSALTKTVTTPDIRRPETLNILTS
ncbi:hypothetical protein NPIL_1001 [Nephila pilipes]|uniref:Uncharacterized protein n=1 Tax=Nephila pilipes TaxID=299642 RepID=A0A8X6NPN0_NEPPI|nr:hypothetical protein NPIL_1001 [Nephila pilipes]